MYVRLLDTSNEQLQWGEDIGEQMVSLSQARWKKNVLRWTSNEVSDIIDTEVIINEKNPFVAGWAF